MSEEKRIDRQYGAYRCIRILEVTADTSLYHALNTKTGNTVSLRVFNLRRDSRHPEKLEMMRAECLQEIEIFRKIMHPHLTPILDAGSLPNIVYYTLPLYRGGTLYKRLEPNEAREREDLPLKLPSISETVTLVTQVAAALQAVHDHGLVHGQIEPRAIMLEKSQAYVSEVGMMKLQKILFSLDTTNSFSVTRYSAPELWNAQRPLPASDQYALACVAYELLTGRAPFEAPNILALMRSHMDEAVLPPSMVRPDLKLPTELSLVFWQALAKPVDGRFDTVKAFADAFARALAGQPVTTTDFFTASLPPGS